MSKVRRDIKPRIFRIAVALTIFLAAFIFCTVYFRNNIVPTVMGSAVAEVRAICTNSVNLAVTTVVGGGLKYDDLFTVDKDSDDDVSMVQANSPEINLISREIANLAQANLDALGSQEISVPAGTFTGLALLMGMGPEVTISVIPIDEPTITVTAEVLVAENLIVGDVPQFYFGNSVQNGGFMDLTP